jgi:hypothetical protein
VVDQGALHADEGVGRHLGAEVVGGGAGLGGEQGGQGVGVAGHRQLLAGLQGRAGGDHPVDGPQPLQRLVVAGFRLGQQPPGFHQGASEGGQGRLPGRPLADGLDQLGPERLQPVEEQVFLGREVVEHRRHRDLGLAGDLGHRDPLEAAVGEQPPGRVGDQLACLLLLALAEAQLHGRQHSMNLGVALSLE